MKHFIPFIALAALLLAACSPSNNNTPQELTGIGLNKKSIELTVGSSYQLRVWYEPDEAEDLAPDVNWESTKEKVATVNENGKVTAKEEGTTTIVATCGKHSAECKVEVLPAPIYPFKLSQTSISFPASGGSNTIEVTTDDVAEWTAESSEQWVTVLPAEGMGSREVTITAENTDKEEETTAEITFTCGERNYVVSIVRGAYTKLYFSVSGTKKVVFSPGNLRYRASTNTWSFAAGQYVDVGENNSKISPTYSGWIDLFGWGTGNNPTLTSTDAKDYAEFVDWGVNSIGHRDWDVDAPESKPNVWRTPTHDEWVYLYNKRTDAAKLRGGATVNNVVGYMFLPDTWELPSGISFNADTYDAGSNKYTLAEWQKMEKNGAVFLPCAGCRNSKGEIQSYRTEGFYWSSTLYDGNNETAQEGDAWEFTYKIADKVSPSYFARSWFGRSVRLVKDVN